MNSDEFTRWVAWYRIADGHTAERDLTPDELGEKLTAWAALQNTRPEHGQVRQEPK